MALLFVLGVMNRALDRRARRRWPLLEAARRPRRRQLQDGSAESWPLPSGASFSSSADGAGFAARSCSDRSSVTDEEAAEDQQPWRDSDADVESGHDRQRPVGRGSIEDVAADARQ